MEKRIFKKSITWIANYITETHKNEYRSRFLLNLKNDPEELTRKILMDLEILEWKLAIRSGEAVYFFDRVGAAKAIVKQLQKIHKKDLKKLK